MLLFTVTDDTPKVSTADVFENKVENKNKKLFLQNMDYIINLRLQRFKLVVQRSIIGGH